MFAYPTYSMAMALCRPNMLRYSSWTAVCIQNLEKSAIQSDIHLSNWAKLQHAAEDSAMALGLDDYQSHTNLSDFRTQSTLRALDMQINEWKETIDWRTLNRKMKSKFLLYLQIAYSHCSFS